jgi:hypothetical protein
MNLALSKQDLLNKIKNILGTALTQIIKKITSYQKIINKQPYKSIIAVKSRMFLISTLKNPGEMPMYLKISFTKSNLRVLIEKLYVNINKMGQR